MHTGDQQAAAPYAASQSYRIGCLNMPAPTAVACAALRLAAERHGHYIVSAPDMVELGSTELDFVLIGATDAQRPANIPAFAVIRELGEGVRRDAQALSRLSEYDGYLTLSPSVRRFLVGLCRIQNRQPFIGRFEATPARRFMTCRLQKLIDLGAFRLCCLDASGDLGSPLLAALSDRPYLRTPRPEDRESGEAAGGHERLFAAFGAGLVLPGADAAIDPAMLYRLCEIASVGAVAVCPDIPWLRRLFGETLAYYAADDPETAAHAIDDVIAEVAADPQRAILRAQAARRIFETKLAAEVMLHNAIRAFEEWRSLAPPPTRTLVNTDQSAIANIFAPLPDDALVLVAQAVASLNPLRPLPHWRFGGFEESPDLAVHLRHSIWLAGRERSGMPPITIPWHGGTELALYLDNDFSLTLFAGGAFEPNEFALLDRLLQPGMIFIDGGANEGAYTVFAAARVGGSGRVVAIEPSSRELLRLNDNIALNRLGNVEIVAAALAEHPGSARLMVAEPQHAGQNTLGGFAYEAVKSTGFEDVAVTTLDEIVGQYGLSRVDILKLDLEGAELRALRAGQRLLAEMRPLVFAEISEGALAQQGGSAAALIALLEAAEYEVLTFDAATGHPVPLRSGIWPLSDNVVAVHRERDWGLLSGDLDE